MRVGIDARLVGRGLGIAHFVTEITRALAARADIEPVWLGRPDLAPAGLEGHRVAGPYPALELLLPSRRGRRLRLDVVHFTGNTGPPFAPRIPTVQTVHDLIYLSTQHSNRAPRQVVGHAYERLVVPRSIRCATRLVTVSHHAAHAIESRMGRGATVIAHGHHVSSPPQPAGTDPPYVAAFAGRDPRKNTLATLRAFQALRRELPSFRLELFARAGLPDLEDEDLLNAVTVHRDLERPWLDGLIARATALLVLSTDEGFGLPVLEGMAIGTPVIGGLAPAVREVGGDALLALRPGGDVTAEVLAHVKALVVEPQRRADAAARGRLELARYSWDRAAAAYGREYRLAAT